MVETLVNLPTVGEVRVKAAPGLKNWRTLLINLGMAAAGPIFNMLSTLPWTDYLPPQYAAVAVIVVNILMRIFWTKGPFGSDVQVEKV